MPAHRHRARAGPADVAAQEQQVHDLLDRRDGLGVVGQAHAPGDHRGVRARVVRGDLAHLRFAQPGAFDQHVPRTHRDRRAAHRSLRCARDERVVEHGARRGAFRSSSAFITPLSAAKSPPIVTWWIASATAMPRSRTSSPTFFGSEKL
jgi:hypothetical protein